MKLPRPSAWVIGSSVLAIGAVTAAAVGFGGDGEPRESNTTGLPAATAPVTRATLTQQTVVNGVLGYGPAVTVQARGDGIITALPALGATLSRGQPVYHTDNRPRPLFYGTLPLYRPLHASDVGEDVREVEQNLAALGYQGFTVDASYTATTAKAVRKWQKDLGLDQSGVFDPTSVVIAPAPLRVTQLIAHLGDPASGPVLAYAGTTKVVTVALDVALQTLAHIGLPATVNLPDGTTVAGTLTAVGTVATAGEERQPATIEVTVNIADQAAIGALDQAPVTVGLVSATVENVLTVPVAALVALAEGGYGLQVVDGPTSRYVAVELGMFAGGRVQVTGDNVTEGMIVGMPE